MIEELMPFNKKTVENKENYSTGIYINKSAHQVAGDFFESGNIKLKTFFPEFITKNPGSEKNAEENDEYIELSKSNINNIYHNFIEQLKESTTAESFQFRLGRMIDYINIINTEKSTNLLTELHVVNDLAGELKEREEGIKNKILNEELNKEDKRTLFATLNEIKEQIKSLNLDKINDLEII